MHPKQISIQLFICLRHKFFRNLMNKSVTITTVIFWWQDKRLIKGKHGGYYILTKLQCFETNIKRDDGEVKEGLLAASTSLCLLSYSNAKKYHYNSLLVAQTKALNWQKS